MGFVGFSALFTQISIDSLLYGGKTTFPLWNFVKFNFFSDNNKVSVLNESYIVNYSELAHFIFN